MWELAATVFLASLVGSVHCVGMCGPFVALTTLGRSKPRRPLAPTAAYNLGRGIAYVGVGALAGTVGMAIDATGTLAGVQRAATTLAGVAMIVIGAIWLLDQLGTPRFGGTRNTVRSAITARLQRAFASTKGFGPVPRALTLGLLTSFMPCGWLYAFAITAAGTADPLHGAVTMAVFWLGTVPILAALGLGLHRLSPLLRRRLPMVMAVVVIAVGLFTVLHRASITAPPVAPPSTSASTAVPSELPPCHQP